MQHPSAGAPTTGFTTTVGVDVSSRTVTTDRMTDEDREIQGRARRFVDDELIPHEVEAEMNGGRLSDEVRQRHRRLAVDLGLYAMNMPEALGGGGMTTFQQVLVSEQL